MAQIGVSITDAKIIDNVVRIKAEVTRDGESKSYEFDLPKAELQALPDKAARVQYAINYLIELRRQLRPPPPVAPPPGMNLAGTINVEEPD